MADYSGVVDARHETAAAGVEDVVTFTADLDAVSITNRSTSAEAFYRVGGDDVDDPPAIAADGEDDAFLLLPGERAVVRPATAEPTRVRIFAAAGIPWSVERA